MRSNIYNKDVWVLKNEVNKLKKMLDNENNKMKKRSIESDLIKFNELVNMIPYAKIDCGINNQALECFINQNNKNLENFLDYLKQHFDFYYDLSSKYQNLYLKKIDSTKFNKNKIDVEDMLNLITYTFDENFLNFCIKELKSNRYFMINNSNINNSICFAMENTRYKNYYIFKTSSILTYYDIYGIIDALSYGYTFLYYKLKNNNMLFKNIFSMFNELIIGENINSNKSFEDYILFNYEFLSNLITNSKISKEFLEYNWKNDFKINNSQDYKYNFENYMAISNLISNLLSIRLYDKYLVNKNNTLNEINYILENMCNSNIFNVFKEIGIDKDSLLDNSNVKKYIKKYQIKSEL